MSQTLSIGRIVHYRLSQYDVTAIDREIPEKVPSAAGDGRIRVRRNAVHVGQYLPAKVTATFGSGATANLVVQLDGEATYWVTSRIEGEDVGTWAWPPRT